MPTKASVRPCGRLRKWALGPLGATRGQLLFVGGVAGVGLHHVPLPPPPTPHPPPSSTTLSLSLDPPPPAGLAVTLPLSPSLLLPLFLLLHLLALPPPVRGVVT